MKVIKISVELSPKEYIILQKLAEDCNISKAEYLRLIIQGIHLGDQINKGENKVEFGGYGYSFKPEEMESLFQEVSEKLQKAIVITPTIGEKRVRYKRIKTGKKVA
jgi:predicted transcriptional regulator